jgi:hypothetical protein
MAEEGVTHSGERIRKAVSRMRLILCVVLAYVLSPLLFAVVALLYVIFLGWTGTVCFELQYLKPEEGATLSRFSPTLQLPGRSCTTCRKLSALPSSPQALLGEVPQVLEQVPRSNKPSACSCVPTL